MTQAEPADDFERLLAFAGAMMALQQRHDWMDLDGEQVQDLLVKHGLRVAVPAD